MPVGSIGPRRQRCLTALRTMALESGAITDDDADRRDEGVTTTGGGR
jgi:hypothetical protein